MTSEFRSHFLHQSIKLLHSAGCDCQRQQNDGQPYLYIIHLETEQILADLQKIPTKDNCAKRPK